MAGFGQRSVEIAPVTGRSMMKGAMIWARAAWEPRLLIVFAVWQPAGVIVTDTGRPPRSYRLPCSESRMNVIECDVPSGSMLSLEVIEHAYFRDSYRVPLSRRELGIVEIFFGI